MPWLSHVHKTKKKMIKINGQQIYSGNMNHFTRNNLVTQIHKYMKDYIDDHVKKDWYNDITEMGKPPLRLEMEYYLPANYGDLRWNVKAGRPKIANKETPTRWDLDNLWIYTKCFQDTLVACGIIFDDDVSTITETRAKFIKVPSMLEAKLIGKLKWRD